MSLRIEAARAEHLPALAALRAAFWKDQNEKGLREPAPGCALEDLAKLLGRARTHLLVALLDGEPVGYLLGQTKVIPGVVVQKASSVEEVMTLPVFRREGAARRLVEAALGRFRDDGADRVQLRVLVENDEAHAFWRRMGFEPYLTTLERKLPP
jgi:ribosomal protein S18 acetylase RimI-like enzyme